MIEAKGELIARVRRIVGQLNRMEAALEAEAGCEEVLHMLAGARGAFNGLSEEIIADFLREHVAAPRLSQAERQQGAEQLITLLRRYNR
jgi:DNA-binding FrmR family transcriptional regulator